MFCRTGRCESPCDDCLGERRLEPAEIYAIDEQLHRQLDGELCDTGVVGPHHRLDVGRVGSADWTVFIVPATRVLREYVYEYGISEGQVHVEREIEGCSLLMAFRNGDHAFRAGWNGYRIDFGDDDAPEGFHNPTAEALDRAILVALLGDDAPEYISEHYPRQIDTRIDTRTHEKNQWGAW